MNDYLLSCQCASLNGFGEKLVKFPSLFIQYNENPCSPLPFPRIFVIIKNSQTMQGLSIMRYEHSINSVKY